MVKLYYFHMMKYCTAVKNRVLENFLIIQFIYNLMVIGEKQDIKLYLKAIAYIEKRVTGKNRLVIVPIFLFSL